MNTFGNEKDIANKEALVTLDNRENGRSWKR